MQFRLRNVSQVFQRHKDNILANVTEFAAAYIDDIIIFSDNAVQHKKHLSEIRDILNKVLGNKSWQMLFKPI